MRGGSHAISVRTTDPDRAEPLLQALPFSLGVSRAAGDVLEIKVAEADDAALLRTGQDLFGAGIGVLELQKKVETLERRFLELTGTTAGELGGASVLADPSPADTTTESR
jgi:PAS domain-containing protein